jgi:ankyrin repeat protein
VVISAGDLCLRLPTAQAFKWRQNLTPRKLWILLTGSILFTISAASAPFALADDLAAARKAIRLQQFTQAAELYRSSAEGGNSEAQYQLGNLYLLGRGVAKDEARAIRWLEQAAAQNHAGAQFTLSQQLQKSAPERANELLQAAAKQGYAPAQRLVERGVAEIKVNQEAPLGAQWFGAARSGRTDQLARLLPQHNEINLTDSAGRTALFYAVTAGETAAVDWLLDKGIDLRHKDNFGLTAVQTAIERRHPELARKLLKAGADKEQILANGDNLLHYAIRLKQYDLVGPLTQAGVNINHRNKEGWTPLDLADYQNAGQSSAALKKLGARHGDTWRAGRKAQDVTAVAQQLDDGTLPAVAKAVVNNNRPLLEQLLRSDPTSVSTVLQDGSTLLILAVKHQKPDMVTTLLKHSANVNQIAYRGVTALHVAVQTDQEAMVKILLAAGANAGIADDSGRDALITALEEDRYSIADQLLTYLMGNTANTAAIKAQLTVARAPVDRYILLATQHHAQGVLDKLLPFASSAAAVDEQQRNALWFAASDGNTELIPRLLQAGVPARHADSVGRTPFQMAVDKGCLECARLLLPHSDIDHQAASGNTALMLAATNKDALLTAWLLQNKAQVDLRNQRGDTALTIAVAANSPEVVRHLLNANASVTRKNRLGFSALDLAKQVSPQMHELVKSKALLGVF